MHCREFSRSLQNATSIVRRTRLIGHESRITTMQRRFLLERSTNPLSPRPFSLLSLNPLRAGSVFKIQCASSPVAWPVDSAAQLSPLLDIGREPRRPTLYEILFRRLLWKPAFFATVPSRPDDGDDDAASLLPPGSQVFLPPRALFVPSPAGDALFAVTDPRLVEQELLHASAASAAWRQQRSGIDGDADDPASALRDAEAASYKDFCLDGDAKQAEGSDRTIPLSFVLCANDPCSIPLPRRIVSRGVADHTAAAARVGGVLSPHFWREFHGLLRQYEVVSQAESNVVIEFGPDPTAPDYIAAEQERARQTREMLNERRVSVKKQRRRSEGADDKPQQQRRDNADENMPGSSSLSLNLRVIRPIPRGGPVLLSFGREFWTHFCGCCAFTAHPNLPRVRWVEKYLHSDIRDIPTAFPDISLGRVRRGGANGASSSFFLVDRMLEAPATDTAVLHEMLRRSCIRLASGATAPALQHNLLNCVAQRLLDEHAAAAADASGGDEAAGAAAMRQAAQRAAQGGMGSLLRTRLTMHDLRVLLAADLVRARLSS